MGAGEFTNLPGLDHESFQRSAYAFRKNIEQDGLTIHGKSCVLDLFNSPDPPNIIIQNIIEFLAGHSESTDFIFYYCGHGEICDHDSLCLLTKTTIRDREVITGLHVRSLFRALEAKLAAKRTYIILDCCYAGQAVRDLMGSALGTIIEKDIFSSLDRKGTALIAASPRQHPARAPAGEPFTLFTGSLLNVLTGGIPGGATVLSFRDVVLATSDRIKQRGDPFLPVPEIHTPRGADIAAAPFFYNMALQPRVPEADLASQPAHVTWPLPSRTTIRDSARTFFVRGNNLRRVILSIAILALSILGTLGAISYYTWRGGCSIAGLDPKLDYGCYESSQLQLEFVYPQEILMVYTTSEGKREIPLENNDGKVEVRITRSDLPPHRDVKKGREEETLALDQRGYRHNHLGPPPGKPWSNWYVITGRKGQEGNSDHFYYKRWYTNHDVVSLEFDYSNEKRATYNGVISTMVKRFRFK
jgi:hypothetical protein